MVNERNDEKDTDRGNEFHTFIILSAKKVLRTHGLAAIAVNEYACVNGAYLAVFLSASVALLQPTSKVSQEIRTVSTLI